MSAKEKLPPTVSPSVRWCDALSRVVAAIVEVVRTDEHALVVVVVPREVERRAVVAARHAQRVVENVPGVERLVRVIVRRSPVIGAPQLRVTAGCSPRAGPARTFAAADRSSSPRRSIRSCAASSASVPNDRASS